MGLLHALGRLTPLILFSILAILGVDVTKRVVAGSKNIGKWLGWALIFVAAIMLITGGPWKPWYEESAIHKAVNDFLLTATAGKIGERGEEMKFEIPLVPQSIAPYVFIGLIAAPIIAYKLKKVSSHA